MQFDFDLAAYDRLQTLQDATESSTNAAVVRKALRVYEWLVEHAQFGMTTLTLSDGETSEATDLRLAVGMPRDTKQSSADARTA